MAFTNPVNKQVKHSGRRKGLNIYNTDKYYNLNLILRSDVNNMQEVNVLTKPNIDKHILETSPAELAMEDTKYIYSKGATYDGGLLDEDYVITMIKKGMQVFYYAPVGQLVPEPVLDALSEGRGGVIYRQAGLAQQTPEYLNNVAKAHEATHVAIDCLIILPDVRPYDMMTALSNLKTNVDNVQFVFDPLHDNEIRPLEKPFYYVSLADNLWHCYSKHKFNFFKELKNPLSGWGMLIDLIADNSEDLSNLKELEAKDRGHK